MSPTTPGFCAGDAPTFVFVDPSNHCLSLPCLDLQRGQASPARWRHRGVPSLPPPAPLLDRVVFMVANVSMKYLLHLCFGVERLLYLCFGVERVVLQVFAMAVRFPQLHDELLQELQLICRRAPVFVLDF
jgi:hypothetical protein